MKRVAFMATALVFTALPSTQKQSEVLVAPQAVDDDRWQMMKRMQDMQEQMRACRVDAGQRAPCTATCADDGHDGGCRACCSSTANRWAWA
jgi:hypothetical protein